MNKKILIKKISNKYVIYYIINSINVEAYIEHCVEDKKIRINELLVKHFIGNGENLDKIEPTIEEITINSI